MAFVLPTLLPFAPEPAARIGGTHGYRVDGDTVFLNADLLWLQRPAIGGPVAPCEDWALQLWACPADGSAPAGATKLAEVPLSTIGGAPEHVALEAPVLPPAGHVPQTIVLALSAGSDGHFHTVHDYIIFPRAEQFVQPRLDGAVSYRFDGDEATLHATRIENPRLADNLSGSLSLELWALAQPYAGGAFSGYRIAGAVLGQLAGQSDWRDVQATLAAELPPPGSWHLSLMLREWTAAAGSMTRDYANFEWPHVVGAREQAPESQLEPALQAQPVVEPRVEAKSSRVSVNRSTESELASIKGLSRPVAKAIVAGRPHNSIEALLDVKGIGAKLLDKLRAHLTL